MSSDQSPPRRRRLRRIVLWSLGGVVVVALALAAFFIAPFILPGQTGSSGQEAIGDDYPTTVSALGDDGRTRTVTVTDEQGNDPELEAVVPGDRLIVSGTGFDSKRGIYVAICQVPPSPDVRPGPCLGGVPELDDASGGEGAVEWASSNWINQEWAWRLFGARSFDDPRSGDFTAYILVPPAAEEGLDCTAVECGIFTRNDHTALDNRIQDLYVPLAFTK